MLKAYCMNMLTYVDPAGGFDEHGFELGFLELDADNDGKVTFSDIFKFVVSKLVAPTQTPTSVAHHSGRS